MPIVYQIYGFHIIYGFYGFYGVSPKNSQKSLRKSPGQVGVRQKISRFAIPYFGNLARPPAPLLWRLSPSPGRGENLRSVPSPCGPNPRVRGHRRFEGERGVVLPPRCPRGGIDPLNGSAATVAREAFPRTRTSRAATPGQNDPLTAQVNYLKRRRQPRDCPVARSRPDMVKCPVEGARAIPEANMRLREGEKLRPIHHREKNEIGRKVPRSNASMWSRSQAA